MASNAAHLLWTGILTHDQEAAVARRLVASELFSGWGLRTLATSNRGYRPVSYHLGSVWPHDTALAAAGLARAGFADEALLLTRGLVAAAPLFADRLPELFCGFPRDPFGFPVAYPTTSSPQAWAAASVLLLVRVLLGLEGDLPHGRLGVKPNLPRDAVPLGLRGLRLAGGRLSLEVDADGTISATERPDGIVLADVSRARNLPG